MNARPPVPVDAEFARILEMGSRYLSSDAAADRDREDTERDRARNETIWRGMVPVLHSDMRADHPDLPRFCPCPTLRKGERPPPNAVASTLSYWRGSARESGNVTIHGLSGTGKTTLAVAGVRAHFDRRPHDVFFIQAPELVEAKHAHPVGRGECPIVERALSVRLLVLDDMGNEPRTPSAVALIKRIFLHRYDNRLDTWVTTGFPLDDIEKIYGDVVRRRCDERAQLIRCEESRR